MKFSVHNDIFKKFPGLTEVLVVARGMNNETRFSKEIVDELQQAEKRFKEEYSWETLKKEERYQKWIDAYKAVLKQCGQNEDKVKKMLPGHLYLTKTVAQGDSLPNINPIVNYYNAFELKNLVPAGGEDFSGVFGDLQMNFAKGDELFNPIGSDKIEHPFAKEIVWKDDLGVTVRMWAWRQTDRTKITKKTRDVYFVFDLIEELYDIDDGEWGAIDNFVNGLKKYLGADVEVYYLNKENPEVEINYETKDINDIGGAEKARDYLEKHIKTMKEKKARKGTKGIRKRKAESMGFKDPNHLTLRVENLAKDALEDTKFAQFEEDLSVRRSNNPKFGDYSTMIANKLAKKLGQNPKEIGEEIVDILQESKDISNSFSEVTVAPNGFINFRLSDNYLIHLLQKFLQSGKNFGKSEVGAQKVITVESPGKNPSSPLHIGHLLNVFLGQALVNLFRSIGLQAVRDDIINDKGVPMGIIIWAYNHFAKGETPETQGKKPDHFVGDLYTKGREAYSQDPEAKKEIEQILRDWEDGDEEVLQTWRKLVNWVLQGLQGTYDRLWLEDKHDWYESELYEKGREIILEHLESPYIERIADGAVIGRIEHEYGVPDIVLLKSDGTTLYHTQDIYLTLQKMKTFDAWRVVWVVGAEQIRHFQGLFSILDALDIMPIDNLYHYAYASIKNADGSKMSSRGGDIITADELLDEAHEVAKKVLEERGLEADNKKVEEIAEKVGIGAIKYAYLEHDPFKNLELDVEEVVSFSGKSGPYVMYAYTRGKSILDKWEEQSTSDETKIGTGGKAQGGKAGQAEQINAELEAGQYEKEQFETGQFVYDLDKLERSLLLKTFQYPEAVMYAANNYTPSFLADYLYDLAKEFNKFYENVAVLDADERKKTIRLKLVRLVTFALKNGLGILGIKVLEEM